MRDCAIRILHMNGSSDHDCPEHLAVISTFLSDDHTPAFSLQPVAIVRKAIDSMPTRNVFCLSLSWRSAGEGMLLEEPVGLAGQGPPQDCLACGMKLVRRRVTMLVADSRERTGDLSCSPEPPLQPRVLNSTLSPVWVRVIALSMSSPSWLTSFTGFTFIRECPRGRSNTQVPAWALGSSSLPDRRARLGKFWRNPLLNRCGERWAAEG